LVRGSGPGFSNGIITTAFFEAANLILNDPQTSYTTVAVFSSQSSIFLLWNLIAAQFSQYLPDSAPQNGASVVFKSFFKTDPYPLRSTIRPPVMARLIAGKVFDS
jgi:hypothetical protein